MLTRGGQKVNTSVVGVQYFGYRFCVVSDGGAEVAHAYLYVLKNDLHAEPFGLLEDVFVDENIREQGVGSKLVEMVIKAARDAGCYKLIATSRNERPKVHQLYLRLGFTEYGREFRMNF